MNKDSPVVSVIMPVRNGEMYLETALDSILSQSFKELEIVIIDDLSTDNSRKIIDGYILKDNRVRVFDGTASGVSAARNNCLAHVTGKFVTFCDCDDLFEKDSISIQVQLLQAFPEYGAVCGGFSMMTYDGSNSVGLDIGNSRCEITEELLNGVTRTHLCTFLIKTEIVQKTGGFREFFRSAEDIDFQFRLAEQTRVLFEPTLFYHYRLHDASTVHTQPSNQRIFYEDLARVFRQQRKSHGTDDLDNGKKISVPSPNGKTLKSRIQMHGPLTNKAWRYHTEGMYGKAVAMAFKAWLFRPFNKVSWVTLIIILFKINKRHK